MSRQFTCTFEDDNIVTVGGTMWSAAGGASVTVVQTNPHSGLRHLRQPGAASGAGSPRKDLQTFRTGGTIWYREYWNPDVLPTSGTTTFVCAARSSGSAAVWHVSHVRADNTLVLVNDANTGTQIATTATISVDTWYRIEVEHVIHLTTGSLTLKLFLGNSTVPLDTVTLDGVAHAGEPTITGNVQQYIPGTPASVNQGQVWFVDDIAINDNTNPGDGSNMSWCGPANGFLLKPNRDIAPSEWTPLSGTDHFAMVDDLPGTCDDDGSYIFTAVSPNEDDFGLTAIPADVPSDAVFLLADTAMRARGDATTPDVQVSFWDSAAWSSGPVYTLSASYSGSNTSQHCVTNLAGKTKADGANFKIGVQLLSDESCFVTAMWTQVEWLESDVAAPVIRARSPQFYPAKPGGQRFPSGITAVKH